MIRVCEERRRSQNEAIKGYSIFGRSVRGRRKGGFAVFGNNQKLWLRRKKLSPAKPNILSIAQIKTGVNGYE